MQLSSSPETDSMIQSLFRSNHQLGVTTRFASTITRVTNVDELTDAIQATLIEFGLTGLFQVRLENEKATRKFGTGIEAETLSRIINIEMVSSKINIVENFILFCLKNFILILDVSRQSDSQIDEIKDNLAIFSDIIDAWLTNYSDLQNYKETTRIYKQDMIYRMEQLGASVEESSIEIKKQHLDISQKLLHMLAARFPMLGLDPDQEEEILHSIESTIDTYGGLISEQMNSNNNLSQLLFEAAECLRYG